jgi:lipopolysaccharide heptosyltransferase II
MKQPKNIIVRMPNWIGDLVMATPVLTDLRTAFPKSSITAMCQTPLGELLKEDKDIDELFSFGKVGIFRRRQERRNIVDKLRIGHFDLGILMTNSFSSAWIFWNGKIKRRIGFKNEGRSILLTDPLSFPEAIEKQHLVVTYKELLSPLDIPISDSKPRLYLKEAEIEQGRLFLEKLKVPKGSKIIGINPGAAYGSAKCWLPDRFKALTRRLLQNEDLYIVYFGNGATASLVDEICRGMPPRVINTSGLTTIREMMALIQICSVFVTNDSGPMHIAAALQVPLVALFGSTNPTKTGPYKWGTVICKQVSCAPCYLRTCPIDFRCMKAIEVDEVYQKVIELL